MLRAPYGRAPVLKVVAAAADMPARSGEPPPSTPVAVRGRAVTVGPAVVKRGPIAGVNPDSS